MHEFLKKFFELVIWFGIFGTPLIIRLRAGDFDVNENTSEQTFSTPMVTKPGQGFSKNVNHSGGKPNMQFYRN